MVMHIDDIINIKKEAGCWDKYISNKIENILTANYNNLSELEMDDDYLQMAIDYIGRNKPIECYKYYKHIYDRIRR